jgi:hypothetical protein
MALASPPTKFWPELYGFWIYGDGPTYIIRVEPGSIAEKAGIRTGDKIIELDNRDVSKKSASFLKQIANSSKNKPPPISVQSFYQIIDLKPDSKFSNYGLHVRGEFPIQVKHVDEMSPAFLTDIRPGILKN